MRKRKPVLNLFLFTVIVSGFIAVFSAGAEDAAETSAKLIIPYNVDVKSLDGKEVKLNLVGIHREVELDIAKGVHEIELRYSDIWESGVDDHETVKSMFVTVSFYANTGCTYRISHLPLPDLESARKFADKPRFQVKKESGPEVAKIIKMTPAPQHTDKPQPIPTDTPVPKIPSVDAGPDGASVNALQMLLFWWSQASEEEQAEFIRWITPDEGV